MAARKKKAARKTRSKLVCPKRTKGGKQVHSSKGRCWVWVKTPVKKVARKGAAKRCKPATRRRRAAKR